VRMLATVEPALAQRLRALSRPRATWTAAEYTCAEVIRHALDGLPPQGLAEAEHGSTDAVPLPGNQWPHPSFELRRDLYIRDRAR